MDVFQLDMNKYESYLLSASVNGIKTEMNGNAPSESSDSDSESDSSSASESASEENEVKVESSAKSSNSGSSKSSSESESDSESESENKTPVKVERLSDASDSLSSEPEYNGKVTTSESDVPEENKRKKPKKRPTQRKELNNLKQLWEKNPEEFGIRRSGRSRKEPARYIIGEDSDSSNYSEETDSKTSKHKRKQSQNWNGESEEGKLGTVYHNSLFQPTKKLTKSTKKKANQNISYSKYSMDETDSDDLIDVVNSRVEVEEDTDTIEKVMDHRLGKIGATGAITTVYAIADFGDPNDVIEAGTEDQYYIKWKGWAHLHNTWESDATLKENKVQGLKKLQNFVTKLEQLTIWKARASPEDLEYFECQQEMSADVKDQYLQMERIICHRPSQSGEGSETEYFCKWACLPYSESTWEDGNLIGKMYPDKISKYFARLKSVKIPSKVCEALKIRPKFVPYTTQPDYIGGHNKLQLRDYQLDGLNWLASSWCKRSSAILADEMGLGKTIQTISFLNYLFSEHAVYGPFLLVVPLSTMTAWQREFEIWAPEMNVIIYLGDTSSRGVIQAYEWCHPGNKRLKFNAVITTYELLSKDKMFLSKINWAVLGVDEAHRLKNEESLLYKSLCEFNTNHRLLITGTPLQNSLRELYALLHFIMPQVFPSWSEFEAEHQNTADKGYPKLHTQLIPYLLRRVKKDVEKSLPAKVERILRVEMTTVQKQFYKWILTKNYKALNKGLKGNQGSFNNIIMELKKCCNHAMLVRPVDNPNNLDTLQHLIRSSGKLVLLDKLLCRLKETGHRVLIFSQMVRMLDIISEYMQLRHFSYQRLDGSIKGELRKQAMDHFNAEGSQDFCFLLSTRAGGLGINLTTADTVIIFDSDWNPQNDLQAQARAHRIGQKNQVNIYRLVTKSSVEEDIIERAKKKMVLDHLVIQRMDTTGRTVMQSTKAPSTSSTIPFNKEELSAILKFGAEELFKEDEDSTEPQVDIDEILSRAEYREEQDQPATAGEELLSAFKIASINFNEDEVGGQGSNEQRNGKDWADIIPESERKIMEAEERQKEELALYLPPRNRKSTKRVSKVSESEASDNDFGSRSDKDDSGEDKPKRRGRPRIKKIEAIKNFTDTEIKRFLKSYKKFPMPLTRLDAIAMDAELQGKSLNDLIKIGDLIKSGCEKVMKEYLDDNKENKKSGPKKRGREKGPSFKVGGISINAKTLFSNEAELEPLGIILPFDPEERKRWVLSEHVKDAHFGIPWTLEDDSRLLRGVYKHGMGNWESIKMDPELELGDKILPDGEQRPQSKNLQTRIDYLLKVLKKMTLVKPEEEIPKTKRGRKPKVEKVDKNDRGRKSKVLSKAFVENDDSDVDVDSAPTEESNMSGKQTTSENTVLDDKSNKDQNSLKNLSVASSSDSKSKKKKSKSDKSKKALNDMDATLHNNKNHKKEGGDGPSSAMPNAANAEPQVHYGTNGDEGLSPLFIECREKMLPVKRYLHKFLSIPNDENKEKVFTRYLLKVGARISAILSGIHDMEQVTYWRSHLWEFVSYFTTKDPKDLYTMYRQAIPENTSKVKKEKKTERKSIADTNPKRTENERPDLSQYSNPKKRHADEDSNRKSDRPPKKRFKDIASERRDKYDSQQPSTSHSNPSYGQHLPVYTPPIKPHTSSSSDNHTNAYYRSSQGHADTWKRESD